MIVVGKTIRQTHISVGDRRGQNGSQEMGGIRHNQGICTAVDLVLFQVAFPIGIPGQGYLPFPVNNHNTRRRLWCGQVQGHSEHLFAYRAYVAPFIKRRQAVIIGQASGQSTVYIGNSRKHNCSNGIIACRCKSRICIAVDNIADQVILIPGSPV